jgi:PleD family two-component response regulator
VDDLLNPADALLYKAKAAGKNRIHASEVGIEA